MEITNVFGERLKALRNEAALSQTQLAERLGVSRVTISYYENSERTADIEFLNKTAEFFYCSTDYLLGLSNYRNVEEKENIEAFCAELTQLLQKLWYDEDKEEIVKVINDKLRNFNNALRYPFIYNIFGSTEEIISAGMNTIIDCSIFLLTANAESVMPFLDEMKDIWYEAICNILKQVSVFGAELWDYCSNGYDRTEFIMPRTNDIPDKFRKLMEEYNNKTHDTKTRNIETKKGE